MQILQTLVSIRKGESVGETVVKVNQAVDSELQSNIFDALPLHESMILFVLLICQPVHSNKVVFSMSLANKRLTCYKKHIYFCLNVW